MFKLDSSQRGPARRCLFPHPPGNPFVPRLQALLNGGMPPASVKFGALGSSGWRSPWWASRGFARNEQHNAAKVGHGDNARPNHCLIYVPLIELGEVRCSSVLTKWDAHQSIHAGCGKKLMESGVNMMETDWNGRGCECPARFGRNL